MITRRDEKVMRRREGGACVRAQHADAGGLEGATLSYVTPVLDALYVSSDWHIVAICDGVPAAPALPSH